MRSIRARFIRGEGVKFISHLDLMKVFERAIRRAGIPIAYSQGFNPHPQMVFGLPLSVGVTSDAEYMDIQLTEDMEPETFADSLNCQLPMDLKICQTGILNRKTNIMSEITHGSYEVKVESAVSQEVIQRALSSVMSLKELVVRKESKKGTREVDIRPMILDLSLSDAPSTISMLLRAGGEANLKPELLVSALNEKEFCDLKIAGIKRTGLFVSRGGSICHPLDERALSEV